MLPPVSSVVLSLKSTAPPTVTLPAVLLPITMLLAPFVTSLLPPLNKLAGNDNVPVPEPKPMDEPLVKGSKVTTPVVVKVFVPLKLSASLVSVTAPLCPTPPSVLAPPM